MSKAILLSIKPKYVADILNGKKTIEIRKTMPKCDLPIDVYIYCTKNGETLTYWVNGKDEIVGFTTVSKNIKFIKHNYNGRVVAKFTLRKCQDWHNYSWQEICEKGCVSDEELHKYCSDGKDLFIWHIEDLVIFDKPKELWQFEKFGSWRNYQTTCKKALAGRCNYGWGKNGKIGCEKARLTKAPQNFCYVESEE